MNAEKKRESNKDQIQIEKDSLKKYETIYGEEGAGKILAICGESNWVPGSESETFQG